MKLKKGEQAVLVGAVSLIPGAVLIPAGLLMSAVIGIELFVRVAALGKKSGKFLTIDNPLDTRTFKGGGGMARTSVTSSRPIRGVIPRCRGQQPCGNARIRMPRKVQ